MLSSFKEKSWSVLLVKGYLMNNQVRGSLCANCKSPTHALTVNFGNPNLFLYECGDPKCKHRLLRFDFDDSASFKINAPRVDQKAIA